MRSFLLNHPISARLASLTSLCLLGLSVFTASPLQALPASVTPAAPPQVQFDFKVVELPEKNSDTREEITAALAKADLAYLNDHDLNVLTAPSVSTEDGVTASVEVTRDISYPSEYETDKSGKLTPSQFRSKRVGVQIEAVPMTEPGGSVKYDLKCTITAFVGWINDPTNGTRQPVFNVRRLKTQRWLADGASDILWVGPDPVERFDADNQGFEQVRNALIVTVHRLQPASTVGR